MDTQTMNTIAVILGPIVAVVITLFYQTWYQNHKDKMDLKHRVFLSLMAYRKTIPLKTSVVDALNTIQVVFSDNPKILQLWSELYPLLGETQDTNRAELRNHKYLDLILSIADSLGYKNLKQTDIDKFYNPQPHVEQKMLDGALQVELLRVLQNTERFVVIPRENNEKAR